MKYPGFRNFKLLATLQDCSIKMGRKDDLRDKENRLRTIVFGKGKRRK